MCAPSAAVAGAAARRPRRTKAPRMMHLWLAALPRCSASHGARSSIRFARRRSAPAAGRLVVLAFRLDPAADGSVLEVLALPERRAGLQVVHQEFRGLERRAPVG